MPNAVPSPGYVSDQAVDPSLRVAVTILWHESKHAPKTPAEVKVVPVAGSIASPEKLQLNTGATWTGHPIACCREESKNAAGDGFGRPDVMQPIPADTRDAAPPNRSFGDIGGSVEVELSAPDSSSCRCNDRRVLVAAVYQAAADTGNPIDRRPTRAERPQAYRNLTATSRCFPVLPATGRGRLRPLGLGVHTDFPAPARSFVRRRARWLPVTSVATAASACLCASCNRARAR